MSARREKRLRALERRVEALETIAATPVFIHTQGDGKEDYVLDAVWSKETADTYPGNRAFAFVGSSGVQMGWLASQADMLADDWHIVK